jgi:hypothetical protein
MLLKHASGFRLSRRLLTPWRHPVRELTFDLVVISRTHCPQAGAPTDTLSSFEATSKRHRVSEPKSESTPPAPPAEPMATDPQSIKPATQFTFPIGSASVADDAVRPIGLSSIVSGAQSAYVHECVA